MTKEEKVKTVRRWRNETRAYQVATQGLENAVLWFCKDWLIWISLYLRTNVIEMYNCHPLKVSEMFLFRGYFCAFKNNKCVNDGKLCNWENKTKNIVTPLNLKSSLLAFFIFEKHNSQLLGVTVKISKGLKWYQLENLKFKKITWSQNFNIWPP